MLVGEAPGLIEEMSGRPFVGQSGSLLKDLLEMAGVDRDSCYLTNVFFARPKGNDIKEFCGKKAEVGGKHYTLPPLSSGNYVRPEYLHHRKRLLEEITAWKPDVVVLLGNTACWAVLGRTGIARIRGVVEERLGTRVIATYHPAAVMRQWDLHTVFVADVMKAIRATEGAARPSRRILVPETLDDLSALIPILADTKLLAFDIETKARQITCIGFAPSPHVGVTIPLWSTEPPFPSVWSAEDEPHVWSFIARVLDSSIPKLAQNGLYDLQYLWSVGIPVRNYTADTMLLHHALQPELPKGLGFLGSVYADVGAWKLLPKRHDTLKKDE